MPLSIIMLCKFIKEYIIFILKNTKIMDSLSNMISWKDMMTSSNENIFGIIGHLCKGIHWSHYPHKGQWRGALMLSLIYARINSWENNGEAGDLRCHHTHYDVTVMIISTLKQHFNTVILCNMCEMYRFHKVLRWFLHRVIQTMTTLCNIPYRCMIHVLLVDILL